MPIKPKSNFYNNKASGEYTQYVTRPGQDLLMRSILLKNHYVYIFTLESAHSLNLITELITERLFLIAKKITNNKKWS